MQRQHALGMYRLAKSRHTGDFIVSFVECKQTDIC